MKNQPAPSLEFKTVISAGQQQFSSVFFFFLVYSQQTTKVFELRKTSGVQLMEKKKKNHSYVCKHVVTSSNITPCTTINLAVKTQPIIFIRNKNRNYLAHSVSRGKINQVCRYLCHCLNISRPRQGFRPAPSRTEHRHI